MRDGPHSRYGDSTRPGPRSPFKRGEFKYVILHFLKDKPSHGYEIMRELEERFHSFYVPSPGSIYPTLDLLEEMGYVTCNEEEGRRIYTITREGLDFLSEQKGFTEEMRDRIEDWCNSDNFDDIKKTMGEFDKLVHLLKQNVRTADAEKLGNIRRIISRACKEVSEEISGK